MQSRGRLECLALMREDIAAVKERDPAAKSSLEIVLLYSGLHALWAFRFHHWLWIHGWRFVARALSQVGAFDHRHRNPSRRRRSGDASSSIMEWAW